MHRQGFSRQDKLPVHFGNNSDPVFLLLQISVSENRRFLQRGVMRTEPRRKERVMESRREMAALLDRMAIGRLALITEEGPYVLPLNYLFADDCIYLHSGLKGKKVEALRADPRVCFLVDEPGPQVTWAQGCGISQIYESVMCFGRAGFVERPEEKRRILEMMIHKFLPAESRVSLEGRNIEKTLVIKIQIEWMTGKANRISPLHTRVSNRFDTMGTRSIL